MSSTDNTTSATTVQGLREAADWLEHHPELPGTYYAIVSFGSSYRRENAREELTALAAALGDGAAERLGPSPGEVTIEGYFQNVRVHASARVQDLRDEAPPVIEYDPIIPVATHTTTTI